MHALRLLRYTMGIDPNKVQIVESCLEASFKDVRSDRLNQRFVFNDGKQSSELVFNREFIDDILIDRLKTYMETNVIPTLQANPDKRIYVSNGRMKIGDKDSN
jgi:hypothetical protein